MIWNGIFTLPPLSRKLRSVSIVSPSLNALAYSLGQNCWDTVVFLPSHSWCARFGELTAINNIVRTRRRQARSKKTAFGGRVLNTFVWDCRYPWASSVFLHLHSPYHGVCASCISRQSSHVSLQWIWGSTKAGYKHYFPFPLIQWDFGWIRPN